MEDLVKRIMDWNNIQVKTKGWPTNKWRDKVTKDLKKIKLKNWSQVVKDRKAWNCVEQQNKNPCKVVLEEEEEEEEEKEKKKKKEKENKKEEEKKEKERKDKEEEEEESNLQLHYA